MKAYKNAVAAMVAVTACFIIFTMPAAAKSKDVYHKGIHVGAVDISGMSKDEAKAEIEEYVKSMEDSVIVLNSVDGNQVRVTAKELGINWADDAVLDKAMNVGEKGNLIERFKALADLEKKPKVYELELSFDNDALNNLIGVECTKFDDKFEDASIKRENGQFTIEGGTEGKVLDVDASKEKLETWLSSEWDGNDATFDLVVRTQSPQASAEELSKIKDLLGSYTTKYTNSGSDRCANVANGCRLINGTVLLPGQELSVLKTITPFSEENGYRLAGSYSNGMVVESFGGGICQVSTTLYNAVLLSELEVVERHNHSMIVNYVDPSADAAIAESAGTDFRIRNNTQNAIYIEGYTQNKTITFNIFGVETRAPGHKVKYESEIISETVPEKDAVYTDASQPIGYVKTQGVHKGYNAKLWKIVTENGTEVSREVVNTSNYKAVPRTATFGTKTSDPTAANLMAEALATNDIDHIKSVAASLKAGDTSLGGTVPQTPDMAALLALQQALAAQQTAAGNDAAAAQPGDPNATVTDNSNN